MSPRVRFIATSGGTRNVSSTPCFFAAPCASTMAGRSVSAVDVEVWFGSVVKGARTDTPFMMPSLRRSSALLWFILRSRVLYVGEAVTCVTHEHRDENKNIITEEYKQVYIGH